MLEISPHEPNYRLRAQLNALLQLSSGGVFTRRFKAENRLHFVEYTDFLKVDKVLFVLHR